MSAGVDRDDDSSLHPLDDLQLQQKRLPQYSRTEQQSEKPVSTSSHLRKDWKVRR